MQRDAKGRFASTEQKRGDEKFVTAVEHLLQDMQDLAHLHMAEEHLRLMDSNVTSIWSELESRFFEERREYLRVFIKEARANVDAITAK